MSYVSLKGFLNGADYQKRGRPIDVSGERARELLRLGLIGASAGKAAPTPDNKMTPAPENKEGGPAAPAQAVDYAGLLGKNAPEVVDAVSAIADPEALRGLLAAEEAGKARKSVIEAIQAGVAARSA